jgi:glycosyltransferase involved in cell wall biosynthesis
MPISIVMPTYNRMDFLKQAIDSVLSQSYSDWELLISDDGSKDGTRAYLSSLTDPRIKVHFQPANLGQFGNLNFLFSHATHAIAQILCDDDYFTDRDALQRLVDQWSQLPPEIAFLRSNHSADANSELARFESSALPQVVQPDKSDLFFGVFGCISGSLSNVSARTAAVNAAGGFRSDLPYGGDFEFWSRLGRVHPWFISKVRVTQIRTHAGQVAATLSAKGEVMRQLRVILDPVYRNLVSKGYSPALIRLMFTINYISLQRYLGVTEFLRGKGRQCLQCVYRELDLANFSLGSGLGWLVFFGSLGGRIFRVPVAKRLLRQNVYSA